MALSPYCSTCGTVQIKARAPRYLLRHEREFDNSSQRSVFAARLTSMAWCRLGKNYHISDKTWGIDMPAQICSWGCAVGGRSLSPKISRSGSKPIQFHSSVRPSQIQHPQLRVCNSTLNHYIDPLDNPWFRGFRPVVASTTAGSTFGLDQRLHVAFDPTVYIICMFRPKQQI